MAAKFLQCLNTCVYTIWDTYECITYVYVRVFCESLLCIHLCKIYHELKMCGFLTCLSSISQVKRSNLSTSCWVRSERLAQRSPVSPSDDFLEIPKAKSWFVGSPWGGDSSTVRHGDNPWSLFIPIRGRSKSAHSRIHFFCIRFRACHDASPKHAGALRRLFYNQKAAENDDPKPSSFRSCDPTGEQRPCRDLMG